MSVTLAAMFDALAERAGLPADASLPQVVDAVCRMPYGRPTESTPEAAIAEWRGTRSVKHRLLASVLAECWPLTEPRLVHRVHLCTPELARSTFGAKAAEALPAEGLWDVHRYLTAEIEGERVVIDATFPADTAWDGTTSMSLTAGPGSDHECGPDPDREERVLEAAYCTSAVREPFLMALATVNRAPG